VVLIPVHDAQPTQAKKVPTVMRRFELWIQGGAQSVVGRARFRAAQLIQSQNEFGSMKVERQETKQ
jgi:hypothetical protein